MQQGIDDRVSRDDDILGIDTLLDQILSAHFSGGKVQCCDMACEHAVGLFWPGGKEIARPEAGLYVPDRDLVIECYKGGHKDRRRVALYHD